MARVPRGSRNGRSPRAVLTGAIRNTANVSSGLSFGSAAFRRVGGASATVPAAVSAFAQSGYGQTIGAGPITISWTAPNNGGAAITSYTLTYTWRDADTNAVIATLHTRTSSATSYTIEEASPNGVFAPDSGSIGAQPRWSFGNYYFRVTVSATNSVGTGASGSYAFSTGGGD